jgi:hypothetical protein
MVNLTGGGAVRKAFSHRPSFPLTIHFPDMGATDDELDAAVAHLVPEVHRRRFAHAASHETSVVADAQAAIRATSRT